MKLDFLTPYEGQDSYESRVITSKEVKSPVEIFNIIKMFILKHLDYFNDFSTTAIACDGDVIFDLRKEGQGWTLYGWNPTLHKWEYTCDY